MEFEDLQKIWDTQNDRPVFSMNDSRLAVGLYQQREHFRRRLFRWEFVPIYFMMPLLAAGAALLFLLFLFKTIYKVRLTDPQMSVWDGVALATAMGAAIAVMVSMYIKRRKHERTQNVFAPTLREELERGISQLDFELSLNSTPRVMTIIFIISLGTSVIVWEVGRLNGDSAPWMTVAYTLFLICGAPWVAIAAKAKAVEELMQRRRALESMLAALNEDPEVEKSDQWN